MAQEFNRGDNMVSDLEGKSGRAVREGEGVLVLTTRKPRTSTRAHRNAFRASQAEKKTCRQQSILIGRSRKNTLGGGGGALHAAEG